MSFQAHAFSDGESIHLKLPGGLVSLSSDARQPSGSPYLYAALAAVHPLLSTTQFLALSPRAASLGIGAGHGRGGSGVLDEAVGDRIGHRHEDDRNRRGLLAQYRHYGRVICGTD